MAHHEEGEEERDHLPCVGSGSRTSVILSRHYDALCGDKQRKAGLTHRLRLAWGVADRGVWYAFAQDVEAFGIFLRERAG